MLHETAPKKIKEVLEENDIGGVVRGYTTRKDVGVAFTGWDKDGGVVCVLTKMPGEPKWRLTRTNE